MTDHLHDGTGIDCWVCGTIVIHQPIPEDSAHCECNESNWANPTWLPYPCDCPCHNVNSIGVHASEPRNMGEVIDQALGL